MKSTFSFFCLSFVLAFALESTANSIEPPTIVKRFESEGMPIRLEQVGTGFRVPWALEFIDSNTVLINQKAGLLTKFDLKARTKQPIQGLPAIAEYGQGGLLDIAQKQLDPNDWYYFTYTKETNFGVITVLARAKLRANFLVNWQTLLETRSGTSTGRHFGSRITFDPKGFLYFGIGDRGERSSSQDLQNHQGTVIRLFSDGAIPKDNPFVNRPNALPEIWSYGHRNPQGIAFDSDSDRLWLIEHGPRGGDEINLVQKGRNYGWPVISYGKEYWGPVSVGEGTHKPGMEQPVLQYTPSIAPGSLIYYNAEAFPKWRGNLLAGALKLRHLNRVEIDAEGGFVKEDRLLDDLEERVRSLEISPEGWIYFGTDRGNLYRLVPDS